KAEEARSLRTMAAPRQKEIKESATVVATTTRAVRLSADPADDEVLPDAMLKMLVAYRSLSAQAGNGPIDIFDAFENRQKPL
ncbi:MAG: hypothetical protein KGN84_14785, partial [Acidobacteriota bacterium]|nr:hypothetical protein [Acidobacteriota bacterium]